MQIRAESNKTLQSISAVIPVKNGERYIASAIESLLKQHLTPSQIIVVDDGSKDRTEAVVRQFGRQVIFVRNPRSGTAAARNLGIRTASHPLVTFLDMDDISRPERLIRQARQLAAFPHAALGFCAFSYFSNTGSTSVACPEYEPEKMQGLLFERNRIGSASVVLARKAALESVGGFDETFGSYSEDYDLWLRLSQRYPICYLDERLVDVRLHPGNTSSRKRPQRRNEIRALRKHSVGSIEHALSRTYPEPLEAALAMICVLFRMEDYTEAEKRLEALRDKGAYHHLIFFYFGNLALLNAENERAKRCFRESLNLCREFAPARNNLGVSLAMQGDILEARQLFLEASEAIPIYHDPKWNLEVLVENRSLEQLEKTWIPLRPVLRPER